MDSTVGVAEQAVFACRGCRAHVKVIDVRYLPESCPECDAATWQEGLCANVDNCTAARRPGIRGRSHCHSCGYSVWVPMGRLAGVVIAG